MRGRLYQRTLALLLSAVASAACSSPPPGALDATAASSALAPELLLDGVGYELVGVGGAAPVVLADEVGSSGRRALRFDAPDSPARALVPPGATESRALALAGDGRRSLVAERSTRGESLWIAGPGTAWKRLPAIGARERWLGELADGSGFRSVASLSDGREALLESAWDLSRRGVVYTAPERMRIDVAGADGRHLALRHTLASGVEELILVERSSGDARILLPEREDGRFRALQFSRGGSALLLLADDGGEDYRLELLALADGTRRRVAELPCPPRSARIVPDEIYVVLLSCGGAARTMRFDGEGSPFAEPDLPAGTRLVDWLPAPDGGAVIATAGPTWPSDLAWVDGDGETRPLTYGLPGRVAPPALPRPMLVSVDAPTPLPGELWLGATHPDELLLWLEPREREPRWLEHRPLPAALAASGWAVLRIRSRGSAGFGRALLPAEGGEPDADALADLAAARDWLARRFPSVGPIALLADGSDASRVALRAAHERGVAWSALALVGLELADAASPPVGSESLGAASSTPLAPLHAPTLLLLDPQAPGSALLTAAADSMFADGRLVSSGPLGAFDDDGTRTTARRLFAFFTRLRQPAR